MRLLYYCHNRMVVITLAATSNKFRPQAKKARQCLRALVILSILRDSAVMSPDIHGHLSDHSTAVHLQSSL